jgi:hypothetical protein
MKEARARLLHDRAVVGDGVPMMSASSKDIHINDVVYTSDGDVGPYDRDEVSYSFTAWRVIQINYKERYYRIRCADGCELSIHHEDGCPKMKVFHLLDDAKKSLARYFEKEEKTYRRKSKEHLEKAEEIVEVLKEARQAEAPEPPPAIQLEEESA